jgi:hypothetical protein
MAQGFARRMNFQTLPRVGARLGCDASGIDSIVRVGRPVVSLGSTTGYELRSLRDEWQRLLRKSSTWF